MIGIRPSIEEVRNICLNKKIKLLSTTYNNQNEKLEYECTVCGNRWSGRFHNIKCSIVGCPVCARKSAIEKSKNRNNIRYTQEQVKQHYDERNIVLQSQYVNTSTRLTLKCKKCNYIWETNFHNSKTKNSGCPGCNGGKKFNKEHINELLLEKNVISLSKNYKNVMSKIKLKFLECDHIIEMRLGNVLYTNRGCPICAKKHNISQTTLYNIIQDIYKNCKIYNNFKSFNWLGKQEIDILVINNNFSLAIEYDGRQHYEPVKAFGGEKGFEECKIRDQKKNEKIKLHPEDVKYFIRISYKESLTKENILRILKDNNIPLN